MNRGKIKKNRIAFKICNAVPRVEKYKIGAAVQTLETIRFILFRDDSFTRGQPPISVTGHWLILSYIHMYIGYVCIYSLSFDSTFEIIETT